jgi:hypothetical protein
MNISQLPKTLKLKARAYQGKADQQFFNKHSDDLSVAFNWQTTEEGGDFWIEIYLSKTEKEVYKVLEKTTPNDLEFGALMRKIIKDENK